MQRFFWFRQVQKLLWPFHLHLSSIQNTQQCSFVVHLSLLASQSQNGRRQHLKSFRQKLITCGTPCQSTVWMLKGRWIPGWKELRKSTHQWRTNNLSHNLCVQRITRSQGAPDQNMQEWKGLNKEVLHNVLLFSASRHCYKSCHGTRKTIFST